MKKLTLNLEDEVYALLERAAPGGDVDALAFELVASAAVRQDLVEEYNRAADAAYASWAATGQDGEHMRELVLKVQAFEKQGPFAAWEYFRGQKRSPSVNATDFGAARRSIKWPS